MTRGRCAAVRLRLDGLGSLDRDLGENASAPGGWRRRLETGRCASLTELAAAEKINASDVLRVLLLTLLASAILEAILEGMRPERMTLPALMEGVEVEWRQ